MEESTSTAVASSDVESGSSPKKLERQLSVSEEATLNSSGRLSPPRWLSWIEYPFTVRAPSTGKELPEATGWAMDACARAPMNQAGVFVGTALLRCAMAQAGCTSAACNNTIYGFKPSSLLTMMSAVTGVAAAVLMPVFGAVVDHTRHRKAVGVVSAFMVVAITAAQISLSEKNWFVILVLEAIGGFCLVVHMTAVFAYLPDLTPIESDLSHYTSRFNLRQFATQTVYVGIILIIARIRNPVPSVSSAIKSAREALGIALGFSVPLFIYAWTFLFRKRKPLSKVPEGSNLITAGFVQVGRTSRKIVGKYHALAWFMMSLLWSPEAGAGVILAIAVTFSTVFLQLTSSQVGLASLILLACNLPGSIFSKWMCNQINPLNSYRVGLVYWSTTIAAGAATLTGPERKLWTYLFAALWGLGFGWVYPSQRVLLCTLIPKGQETELMGLFVFMGQILGWLPPLIFTVINERGINMRWGLSVVSFFTFFAAICTLPMGRYEAAVAQVADKEESSSTMVASEATTTTGGCHEE